MDGSNKNEGLLLKVSVLEGPPPPPPVCCLHCGAPFGDDPNAETLMDKLRADYNASLFDEIPF